MKFVAALSLILFMSLQASAGVRPNIVGGSEASLGEFPFIVSLHERWGHICGGSLIRKNWVLTAGHCVTGTKITKIYIGLHDQGRLTDGEMITPKRVIRHPQYNNSTTDFDFALIELNQNSTYTPVEVNTEEIPISDELTSQTFATTAGWGETAPSFRDSATLLQKVSVPLASKTLCEQGYPQQITDQMICAGYVDGGRDACFGDSGGPLTGLRNDGRTVLIGIVSWGEGCARKGKLGVYSKVNSVADWIAATAQ